MKVEAECKACGATGLYRGFAEPKGVAVVCLTCKGSGKETLDVPEGSNVVYKPFTKRKKDTGHIHTVRRSAGSFIGTGVGPTGGSVTYQQFIDGRMPN